MGCPPVGFRNILTSKLLSVYLDALAICPARVYPHANDVVLARHRYEQYHGGSDQNLQPRLKCLDRVDLICVCRAVKSLSPTEIVPGFPT